MKNEQTCSPGWAPALPGLAEPWVGEVLTRCLVAGLVRTIIGAAGMR